MSGKDKGEIRRKSGEKVFTKGGKKGKNSVRGKQRQFTESKCGEGTGFCGKLQKRVR